MKNPSSQRASVIVFAVLLLAAGVFVLAGIAQIGATQAVVGQDEWEYLERRVRLENSRAMARQFMLSRMFAAPVTNEVTFTAADGLGSFTLEPVEGVTADGGDYWTTFSTTNTNVNLSINPFTLMERGGFYRVVVPGTVSDGAESVEWSFQVRTRSPVTAGFRFVQHRPATNNSIIESLDPPYIDMRHPEQFIGFHEMARMRVSSVTNTNANDSGYAGYLDKLTNLAAPVPFAAVRFVAGDADGTNMVAEIDLSDESSGELGAAFTYEVPANAPSNDPPGDVPVTGVRLLGTEVYPLPPLQVIVPESNTNTRTLFLSGRNPPNIGRPVYFNFMGSADVEDALIVDATAASGSWRLGISAASLDAISDRVEFVFDPGFSITGGLRVDGNVLNPPPLQQEQDPGGMDYVADRMMWLEDYRTP
jgi:hypothetical protein